MIQNKKSFTVDEFQKKMEHYCVYQDRCHQEVERKMGEYQLIPEAQEKILLHLMQHNFLNEEVIINIKRNNENVYKILYHTII